MNPRRVQRPPDPRYASIRVDANFFHDTIAEEEREARDELLLKGETSNLAIALPHSVKAEIDHPNTPESAKARANRLVYTLQTGMGDANRLEQVKAAMRGNASSDRHNADATHLYDAALWGAHYFVTCDGRFFKRREQIAKAIHDLWIVRPSALIAIHRAYEEEDEALPDGIFEV